ncbi:RNA-directed DNA polymerase, eukaryota [Tanacetum coccineum]
MKLSVIRVKKENYTNIPNHNLMEYIQKKVGNGENTSFWDDSWLGEVALKVLYKRLYALETCKSISVAEKMGHTSLSHSFRRMPRGGVEQDHYDLLCSKAADLVLPNMSDRWCWSLEGSQEFSVKSTRILIDNGESCGKSKEDDVSKISTSIFVTNFPESFTAKDLFHSCKVYGHIVDNFIPLKRSREGKRFGFVRFINVFNVERAPTNGNPKSGMPEHVKKDGGNNMNGAFTPRKGVGSIENGKKTPPPPPKNSFVDVLSGKNRSEYMESESSTAIVLDDDCLYSKDLSKSLFGRVKEVASLSNLKKALINEGFDDLTIRYMGELWIILEFESVKSKDLFRDNTGAVSWFSVLRQASNDFMPEGRIVWVEVEGIPFKVWSGNTFNRIAAKWGELLDFDDQEDLYFHSKRLCIYTKLRSNIFENFKIVYRGKVCWIRAKEVPGWVPEFLDDSDDESQSEEGINDHEHLGHDEHSCGEDNDVNEVAETLFDESSDEQSIKYPPGFTPEAENREFNLSEENVRSTNVENLKQGNDVEILDEQKDIHDVKGSNTQDSVSACSGKFKRSAAPETGGSILCLLEELVKVGRTMGYNMEGCMNNMTEIIESQGAAGWDGEVVMMGDFNEVRFKSDRFGSVFNVRGADVFNSFIANAGLVEVPLGGSAFTWSHKSATKMSKIDRFLISDGLMNTCPNINAITLERYLSDHRPILFRESTYDYGPIPFRFYHHWLALDGFDNFVIDIWRNTPGDKSNAMRNLMYKLKFLKVRIRGWLSTNRNSTKAEITRLIGELAKLDEVIDNGNATDDTVPRRLEVLNSIQNLNQIQATEAAQKAKIKWSQLGDLLSPVLIYLIMESVHFISTTRWSMRGYGLRELSYVLRLNLSHVFYADDVMFVGIGCDSNINTLVHALECFHRASGLKINMSKSKILGIHVEDVKVKQAASKLGCLILNTPFSYLVLVSIRSRFFKGHDLGSNKASWVKWSNVLTSKEKGGLGVSSLYALNRGLLFKWVWKFYAQKTSLWARVIKAIHGVDGKVGKAINSGASSCWTSIVREVEVLKQQGVNFFEYLQLNMGNGESTTFWEDRWLEGSVLKDIFPRLYVLETNKKVSVGDKLKDFRLDSSFRRKARGGIEQVQYEALFDMVNSISLTPKNDRQSRLGFMSANATPLIRAAPLNVQSQSVNLGIDSNNDLDRFFTVIILLRSMMHM